MAGERYSDILAGIQRHVDISQEEAQNFNYSQSGVEATKSGWKKGAAIGGAALVGACSPVGEAAAITAIGSAAVLGGIVFAMEKISGSNFGFHKKDRPSGSENKSIWYISPEEDAAMKQQVLSRMTREWLSWGSDKK